MCIYLTNQQTAPGAIFGTGTNGAYVGDISKIKKLSSTALVGMEKMVVNTEWGAFNNSVRIVFLKCPLYFRC